MKTLESPALSCRHVCLGYEGEPVIGNLSFSIPEGASLAVLGPSGCGKSTLLSALAGLHPLSGGEVSWSEGGKKKTIGELKTGFVWQNLGLYPWKRVGENLSLPLGFKDGTGAVEREGLVREMLRELRLTGYENRFPSELSGGQRQRLAIGRALIVRPEVLFLDEPFSAIDASLREHLQNFLVALRRTHPSTSILVSHDVDEAVKLGSHILLLSSGKKGKTDFFENPAFSQELSHSEREHPAYFDTVKRIYAFLKDQVPEEGE